MPQTAFRDDCVARIKAGMSSAASPTTPSVGTLSKQWRSAPPPCYLGSAEPLCQTIKKESSRIAARILGVDLT